MGGDKDMPIFSHDLDAKTVYAISEYLKSLQQ
jgi:hypothetical protein